jgi:hypothetical protein
MLNTVSAMRRSGMTWVKKQLRYSLGQDPSSAAGLIQQARANNFKILLGIVGEPSQLAANFDGYIQSLRPVRRRGGAARRGRD